MNVAAAAKKESPTVHLSSSRYNHSDVSAGPQNEELEGTPSWVIDISHVDVDIST